MAEPTAHSQAPAGHPAFPPFEAEHFPSQLAWLAVSFVLLYALMAKVALPRIAAIFAERSKRIGDDLKAAQGQFGNLIFGFAVTEALGIFSLLIALLLLFVKL